MGFKKAQAEQAALKVGVYGAPGSGKTFTTLLFAEGLAKATGKRVACVDTERGTDFYCQSVPERKIHPEAFDFDAIYTRSLVEVTTACKQLDSNKYGIIVIDSLTHLWEAAQAAYAGKVNGAGQIPFHAWGKIKRPYKELIAWLLSSPYHVFLCGRQGNEFAEDDESGELKKVGTKMKAEGESAYEPHILLHMEVVKDKKGLGANTCFAEKDRTGILSGRTIVNPNFDNVIKPLLKLLGDKQARIETEEEAGVKDAEAIAQNEATKARLSKELFTEFAARMDLAKTKEELLAIGKEITPEMKRRLGTEQTAALKEKYTELMAKGVAVNG